jgi:hypothetical protein
MVLMVLRAAAAPPPSSAGTSSRAFGGAGYTLGSDEVESTHVDSRGSPTSVTDC